MATSDPDFETKAAGDRGALILQKHNASGLPEHDDVAEVPIRFGVASGSRVAGPTARQSRL